jgi:hypothetical protein
MLEVVSRYFAQKSFSGFLDKNLNFIGLENLSLHNQQLIPRGRPSV